MTLETVEVKLLNSAALPPSKMTDGAAGLDLYCDDTVMAWPHDYAVVTTGVSMKIPEGYVGLIRPRSGLAMRSKIDVRAGVIDSDYRGEVRVLLRNESDNVVEFKQGDRVAQLVIVPVPRVAVKLVNELDETKRGSDGFGSTGK